MVEGGGVPESGSGSKPASLVEYSGDRVRFTVELRPDETTIVSWKKLLKEANSSKPKGPGPSHEVQNENQPVSELHPQPAVASSYLKQPSENEPEGSQAETGPNRLSNVIERIERMYAGNGSSDEEDLVLDNMPDDDEYDTEDSFIDDAELDDYFQVDNSTVKHDGFFVNRGKLEHIEPIILANQQPKKRRRKDLTKVDGQSDDGRNSDKHVKMESKGRKASSATQRNSTSQSCVVALPNIHDQHLQFQASPINAPENSLKKKNADTRTTLGLPNGDDAISQDNSELQVALTQRSNDKSSHIIKAHSGKQPNNVDDLGQSSERKQKGGLVERLDLNVPASRESLPTMKVELMQRKEGSSVRSKSTLLEKAIRELEKIVAESRPPSTEVQDPDNSSQAVKRRLSPEIKQNLAKVARLTLASYKCIPKEVIDRLMSIVGHLMQVRTLKRNLRVMASMSLSAKQEKDDRVQKIKQEVVEMVKMRIPYMKSKIGKSAVNSGDFQEARPEEKEALKRKYSMDDALEDKIHELYDLYVERLEEDTGPPVRRLYEELVVLWPGGFMDINGIKRAIYRAKERKRLYSMRKDQEKTKKKKTLAPKAAEATNVTQPFHIHEKLSSNSPHVPVAFANIHNMEKSKQEKLKGSSSINLSSATPSNVVPKKKVKNKTSSEVVETQSRLEKLAVSQVEGRDKHRKHVSVPLTKSNVPSVTHSSSEHMS